MSNMSVAQLRGTTPAQVSKLKAQSITNSSHLLERGGTPQGREALAKATGLSHSTVLELVNRADLARVKGIGRQYSNLLEDAGVDSVKELAQRNPDHLHGALRKQAGASGVKQAPSARQISDWVRQAKALPRAVTY
jgi:predicted flap endonuclease-1-like 5' DNA nuclease